MYEIEQEDANGSLRLEFGVTKDESKQEPDYEGPWKQDIWMLS